MQYLGTKKVEAGGLLLNGLHARTLTLVPEKQEPVVYPLRVVSANGSKLAEPEYIVGPTAWEPGYVIETVELNAQQDGGRDGDIWHIYVERGASVTREHFLRNAAGYLQTAPQDSQVLFDLNSEVDTVPFLAAWSGDVPGTYYVAPGDPKTLTLSYVGAHWDVSRFKNLLVSIEQIGIPLGMSLKAFVYGLNSPDGDTLVTVGAGNTNEFGFNGSSGAWDGSTGYIRLGSRVGWELEYASQSPLAFPLVRIGFMADNFTEDWPNSAWWTRRLRLRAMVW
jgi:hypothetical protein